ncbi:hypothetical protein SPRG_14875 [Saprolegnia parasitica CBS 223.65]|uniref:Uncharacterized protein n=1 Tax=Saprolegnia parasitica (strain CBS 223.65) TaxID=695850 RepID=A0A067BRC5_SAPPC|nr:hypothetical protein SPRG_14875 [Saprolegnia parasitica CBS 223.65]KDO19355.1 hypothetical protein SPRG_14875 [Saprolegnia parasitica CBS 223.65]|eukprot:XP_012209943.1 hypothetical protein SPRG_14875 [Saprolegnia parasitica CBS 223.65]
MLSMPFVVALLTRKYSMDGRPGPATLPTADEWGPRYDASGDRALKPTTDALVTKHEYRDRSDTASTVSTSASHDLAAMYYPAKRSRRRHDDDENDATTTFVIPEGAQWRSVFERLYQPDYHQKRDERLAETRERIYAIECTFRPAIAARAAANDDEDDDEAHEDGVVEPATMTIVARLYSPTYHQDRLARLEAKRQAYAFHPTTNEPTRQLPPIETRLYSATYLQERNEKLLRLKVQLELVECTFTPSINTHMHVSVRKPLYDPSYHQTRSSILLLMQDRQMVKPTHLRRTTSTASTSSTTTSARRQA